MRRQTPLIGNRVLRALRARTLRDKRQGFTSLLAIMKKRIYLGRALDYTKTHG